MDKKLFDEKLAQSQWLPHTQYSVFTQYDKSFYLKHYQAFLKKYRTFNTIAELLKPKCLIELGCCAGSAGDAFLSAVPEADYLGIDIFGQGIGEDGQMWDSYSIATDLFKQRGYKKTRLLKKDLRTIESLEPTDFVFVDAKHDAISAYQDLLLAFSADPLWILCDDYSGTAKEGIHLFEKTHAKFIESRLKFDYIGEGLLLSMKEEL